MNSCLFWGVHWKAGETLPLQNTGKVNFGWYGTFNALIYGTRMSFREVCREKERQITCHVVVLASHESAVLLAGGSGRFYVKILLRSLFTVQLHRILKKRSKWKAVVFFFFLLLFEGLHSLSMTQLDRKIESLLGNTPHISHRCSPGCLLRRSVL